MALMVTSFGGSENRTPALWLGTPSGGRRAATCGPRRNHDELRRRRAHR
jgi:hypothetical protein